MHLCSLVCVHRWLVGVHDMLTGTDKALAGPPTKPASPLGTHSAIIPYPKNSLQDSPKDLTMLPKVKTSGPMCRKTGHSDGAI